MVVVFCLSVGVFMVVCGCELLVLILGWFYDLGVDCFSYLVLLILWGWLRC